MNRREVSDGDACCLISRFDRSQILWVNRVSSSAWQRLGLPKIKGQNTGGGEIFSLRKEFYFHDLVQIGKVKSSSRTISVRHLPLKICSWLGIRRWDFGAFDLKRIVRHFLKNRSQTTVKQIEVMAFMLIGYVKNYLIAKPSQSSLLTLSVFFFFRFN